jgi:hypothetical protein
MFRIVWLEEEVTVEVKNSEFFRNMKKLPPPGSREFEQLIDWEEEKCKTGVTVNGVLFSGWLYAHLNHWHIRVDRKDNRGQVVRVRSLPDLRDNEWIMAEALERARVEQKGYLQVGLRQAGKSEMEASSCGLSAILYENTQNVIVAGNDADLALLKDKVDFGLKCMWEGLYIPRLDKTWKTNMLRLGFKDTRGDDEVWSYIMIRNAADGKNTEAAAGTTAKSFIMDEIGKYSFAQSFEAARPAFNSEFGWRAVPILVGTGGSFEKGQDAERFFYHPDENNFVSFDDGNGKRTGLFLPGTYRPDCKVEMKLSDWLRSRGIELSKTTELDKIIIKVKDEEKAIKKINEEREKKKKDPDQMEYLKAIMYHPLTPDECFLTAGSNLFNIRIAKEQQTRIREQAIVPTYIFLEHDGEKIVPEFTEKRPVQSFPAKHNEDKDCPIQIWEMPMVQPPHGLYTAGVDSYRQASAKESDSLGAVYIFKRVHNIHTETFRNMIVACYVARPEDKDRWNEQARLLIKWYNARALVENDEISFIDYMVSNGDESYLEPEPQYLKGILKASTVQGRKYGIHRSADAIREHLHVTLKKYMEKVIYQEKDDKGSIIKEYTGVRQILDPMLLEEISKFNDDINVDRIVAAELAISLGEYLNTTMGIVQSENRPKYESLKRVAKSRRGMFNQTRPMFVQTKKRR